MSTACPHTPLILARGCMLACALLNVFIFCLYAEFEKGVQKLYIMMVAEYAKHAIWREAGKYGNYKTHACSCTACIWACEIKCRLAVTESAPCLRSCKHRIQWSLAVFELSLWKLQYKLPAVYHKHSNGNYRYQNGGFQFWWKGPSTKGP